MLQHRALVKAMMPQGCNVFGKARLLAAVFAGLAQRG